MKVGRYIGLDQMDHSRKVTVGDPANHPTRTRGSHLELGDDQVHMENFVSRERHWRAKGMESGRAFAAARIQMVIDQWPTSWADDELRFLFFGDFQPPEHPLRFPAPVDQDNERIWGCGDTGK